MSQGFAPIIPMNSTEYVGTARPTNPKKGQTYIDPNDMYYYYYDGSRWKKIVSAVNTSPASEIPPARELIISAVDLRSSEKISSEEFFNLVKMISSDDYENSLFAHEIILTINKKESENDCKV